MDNRPMDNRPTDNKTLVVTVGEETGVRHTLRNHDIEFFSEVYKSAETQLKMIRAETQSFFDKYPQWKEGDFTGEPLPHSVSNVIAFIGERGVGKTSAMISFPEKMKSLEEGKSDLKNDIIVLPLINPEKFENSDEIIANVLNMMIIKANEVYERSYHNSDNSHYRKNPLQEETRNENRRKYTAFIDAVTACERVLSLIRRTKDKVYSQDSVEDVRLRLYERSEFADLRTHIFFAVREFINIFYNVAMKTNQPLLIVQIDDIDLNIQQGARIVEEINLYLQLPLVAVLFAVKLDQIRWLIEGQYITDTKAYNTSEFSHLYRENLEFYHMANNYLEKLIPPHRRIELPNPLDDIYNTRLIYMNSLDEPIFKTQNNDGVIETIPQAIMRLLYNKTLLLIPWEVHDTVNFLVPNNMRAFINLLVMLNGLESVVAISDGVMWFNGKTDVLQKNIWQVQSYFAYDWVPRNLPKDYARIILNMVKTPDKRKHYTAINGIKGLAIKGKFPTGNLAQFTSIEGITYSTVIKAIQRIVDVDSVDAYLPSDDEYKFAFAIKFIYALAILRMKYKDSEENRNDLLVFLTDNANKPGENINFGVGIDIIDVKLILKRKDYFDFIKKTQANSNCDIVIHNPFFWWSIYDYLNGYIQGTVIYSGFNDKDFQKENDIYEIINTSLKPHLEKIQEIYKLNNDDFEAIMCLIKEIVPNGGKN